MILHQQLLQPEGGISIPWLALHAESLTLAYCDPQNNRVLITALEDDTKDSPVSNTQTGNPVAFAMMIEQQIGAHLRIPTSHYPLGVPIYDPRSPIHDLPPYLLVNSLDGTTPGILHTQDPVALYLADDSGTLGHAQYFRSSVDLTAEGWAYWWEDAQRAFHKLTVAFMQEAGMPVPQAIADAVKHD